MNIDFATKDDLKLLESNLVRKIEQIIKEKVVDDPKKWYNTSDFYELFGASPSKQQSLRNRKVLPHVKLGNTVLYPRKKIDEMIENNEFANYL